MDAIRAENDLAPDQQHWLQINAEQAQKWPVITQKTSPLPDAAEWAQVQHKQQYLDRG